MSIFYKGAILTNGAGSAKEIYNNGLANGNGYYWIQDPNTGKVFKVYCDMTTLASDGGSGWMLVASWDYSTTWSLTSTSSSDIFGPTPKNCFSSNFGDFNINQFRITGTPSIANLGTSAAGDWYYQWNTAIKWKQVWAYASGTNKNYMNDTSGDVAGNITTFAGPAPVNNGVSVPRVCLRLFDYAYNIRWSYQATTQRWNNLSDSAGGGQQPWSDFWNGLTTSGYSIKGGVTSGDDGSLGIIPQGDTSNTAAHDCALNQSKIGEDDSVNNAYFGASATASVANGVTDDYPTYFWIR